MSADGDSAGALVARASADLLDFDGPICKLFAEVRAADVAADLCRYLQQRGAPVPDDGIRDPLAILRMSAGLDADIRAELHAELVCAELRASSTAVPTPGADRAIRGIATSGGKLAVVSNNSAEAVSECLAVNRLDDCVSAISARISGDPLLMKPSAYLLDRRCHTSEFRRLTPSSLVTPQRTSRHPSWPASRASDMPTRQEKPNISRPSVRSR